MEWVFINNWVGGRGQGNPICSPLLPWIPHWGDFVCVLGAGGGGGGGGRSTKSQDPFREKSKPWTDSRRNLQLSAAISEVYLINYWSLEVTRTARNSRW